jgi:hypothetical protein
MSILLELKCLNYDFWGFFDDYDGLVLVKNPMVPDLLLDDDY